MAWERILRQKMWQLIESYLSGGQEDSRQVASGQEVLESTARQQCFSIYQGNGIVLSRVLGKYKMFLEAADIGMTPHLCLDGFWESWVTVALTRILQPGWHCIDVGANVGYYSLIMADGAGPAGHVMAIEPNPRCVRLMQHTLEVNGYQSSTTIISKAVLDTGSKTVDLFVPSDHNMNASLFGGGDATADRFEVETSTIDQLTEEWPRVDLIKIDAEGSEQAIWQGMRKTVMRNPSITIIMEISCARYADPHAFLRDIKDAGFALRHIDYDSSIANLTEDQIVNERVGGDWILFLQRA